ncbi:MAG: hypothetical protein JW769_03200 [Parachlamydiales bacterium]|nr:hypothetical protein [Parachlamydiales bacterium]
MSSITRSTSLNALNISESRELPRKNGGRQEHPVLNAALRIHEVSSSLQTQNPSSTDYSYDAYNQVITIRGVRFKVTYFDSEKQVTLPNDVKKINTAIQKIYERIFTSPENIRKITTTTLDFPSGKLSYKKENKELREIDLLQNSDQQIQKPLEFLTTYFQKRENFTKPMPKIEPEPKLSEEEEEAEKTPPFQHSNPPVEKFDPAEDSSPSEKPLPKEPESDSVESDESSFSE